MRIRTIAAALLIATVVGACAQQGGTDQPGGASARGGSESASSRTDARPTPTGAADSPPTSTSATPVPTAVEEKRTFGPPDDERPVWLYIPELEPNERVPLLVLLHPLGGNAQLMARQAGAAELSGQHRVVVASPPAIDGRWRAEACCGEEITPSPDVAYIVGLVDRLIAEFPIDSKRVYVGGFSMGAVLADRLACEAADRFAAVAIVAGTPWSTECDPARPVSVFIMHGAGDSTFRLEEAEALAERWRRVSECADQPESISIAPNATARRSEGCAGGAGVEFVRVDDAGHQWFTDPSATELAWQFFTNHPGP